MDKKRSEKKINRRSFSGVVAIRISMATAVLLGVILVLLDGLLHTPKKETVMETKMRICT